MPTSIQGKFYSSVLKDWVMDLPLRQQGTLLTAVRGCDLTPKFPLDSIERNVTAFIRNSVMNAFDEREVDSEVGCFMQSRIDFDKLKPSVFGQYPLHYVTHLIHALEIIAYQCPIALTSTDALYAYNKFVNSLHLNSETKIQMIQRLNQDRIKDGCIVE